MSPSKPDPKTTWLPPLVLGVLISIIGYLLAGKLDDMKADIKEITIQVGQQGRDYARLEQRVSTLEKDCQP